MEFLNAYIFGFCEKRFQREIAKFQLIQRLFKHIMRT